MRKRIIIYWVQISITMARCGWSNKKAKASKKLSIHLKGEMKQCEASDDFFKHSFKR
jgi:hypothetical protein